MGPNPELLQLKEQFTTSLNRNRVVPQASGDKQTLVQKDPPGLGPFQKQCPEAKVGAIGFLE